MLMGQASKIARFGEGHVTFWCPGCEQAHAITVAPAGPPAWGFNGDFVRPTFTPSILARTHKLTHDERGEWTGEWVRGPDGKLVDIICHSFVTDGQIQFLGDCTHPLAGQTVPLPDLPPAMRDPVDNSPAA